MKVINRNRLVFVLGIAILTGIHCTPSNAAYKDSCNPFSRTQDTPQVTPGYYENISGQCVSGDVNALQNPTEHKYNSTGQLFMNGYTPAWDNRPDNYYSSTNVNTSTGSGKHGH